MISIQGKGVSTGVAIGPLYYYQRAKSTIRRYEVEDTEAEWARFKAAQGKAIEQLGALAEKAREEAGDEAALLFDTKLKLKMYQIWDGFCAVAKLNEGRRSSATLTGMKQRHGVKDAQR